MKQVIMPLDSATRLRDASVQTVAFALHGGHAVTVSSESRLAATAALVGDPARAAMLSALMDGRALTASELARCARITPQTASEHLAKLAAAGMLAVAKQGRHRYHQLASPEVAALLESILALARPGPVLVGPADRAMRRARTCYDHLAGELAVQITDRMIARGLLELAPDGGALTERGELFLADLGVELAPGPRAARRFCRPCLDWSERRPHVAGAVGNALCRLYFARGWLRRVRDSRAVTVTPLGQRGFHRAFELD
jgi:DNA-binding transcriptional ArsR family regulator